GDFIPDATVTYSASDVGLSFRAGVQIGRLVGAVGARLLAYPRSEDNKYVKGVKFRLRAPYLGPPGPFFDGDSPASGSTFYRWAPDGTSLEIEVAQPPEGRTVVWDGEPYKSTSTLWVGPASGVTGVMDIGASTEARLGIVSDIYSRSREKIQLELARVDSPLIAGERVELDAAAMTASPVRS